MSPSSLIKRGRLRTRKQKSHSEEILISLTHSYFLKVWRTAVMWPCTQASLRGWWRWCCWSSLSLFTEGARASTVLTSSTPPPWPGASSPSASRPLAKVNHWLIHYMSYFTFSLKCTTCSVRKGTEVEKPSICNTSCTDLWWSLGHILSGGGGTSHISLYTFGMYGLVWFCGSFLRDWCHVGWFNLSIKICTLLDFCIIRPSTPHKSEWSEITYTYHSCCCMIATGIKST